jgi:hypothetical protein
MNMKSLLPLMALALAFVSCSSQTSGVLRDNGSAQLRLMAALAPTMAGRLHTVSGRMGGEFALDGPSIAQSMAEAPGVETASFTNIDPITIEGNLALARVDEFLSLPSLPEVSRFIRYTPGRLLSIRLDLASGPELLSALSPDVSDYLSLIMAPVSTGERLGTGEYFELVTSVHGTEISREIAAARIEAVIEVPGVITRVRGGSFSGSRARFDIPLIDILVLETPVVYEIEWR